MTTPIEPLIDRTYHALAHAPGVVQVLGFYQGKVQGLHVAQGGKRYLITFQERPQHDGGMTLYEMGEGDRGCRAGPSWCRKRARLNTSIVSRVMRVVTRFAACAVDCATFR